MAHHEHTHALTSAKLRTAFYLTLVILGVEVVAGYRANSLALLSDAGHILTDVFALGLAWAAIGISGRPANPRNTFGYRRTAILAALANAATLLIVTVVVAFEAVERLRHPQTVSGGLMAGAAVAAVLVNVYIASELHGHEKSNLNVRAALLHVVGDIAASIAVILSGIAIAVWHVRVLDPLLSLAIAALIAFGAWQILRETLSILMESTPKGVELDAIENGMMEVPGVQGVHDLHVWSLSDGFRLLSAHVSVPEQSLGDTANLLDDVKLLLHRRFHIEHATLEAECVDCSRPRARPILLYPTDAQLTPRARGSGGDADALEHES
ncbi:MAG: cation diffusion facilitator family transporter [Chloroflexota bacterium]